MTEYEPGGPSAVEPGGSPAAGADGVWRDLYADLGVPLTATSIEIEYAYQRAYQQAYQRAYQDSRWSTDADAQALLARAKAAYEVLSDPQRRVAYDQDAARRSPVTGLTPEEEEFARYGGPRPTARRRHSWNPVDRMTRKLPRPWRIAIDWTVTIVGAILIVLALKQWIVNPYRIPSSSMEPTLHCARPGPGCEAHFSDRVLACRICLDFSSPSRGDIIVFKTPPEAAVKCGEGGTFVKRLIGLPGDVVSERNGYVSVNGKRLKEPYVQKDRRDRTTGNWKVPKGDYFFMGDNRAQSCDSREWGSVPRGNLIGEVFFVYWPPNRIGFR